jgi:8-oxo-dGTP pyrophosphatase MutT (NUDIX family)
MSTKINIMPSATVVILRAKEGDIEVLLLHRNKALSFFGGTWVFPGGKVEKADFENISTKRFIDVARVAGAREVMEETGLAVHDNELFPFSLWTTPEEMPKRFQTWFFFTAVKTGEVVVDNEEITGYQWLSPEKALEAHAENGLPLSPPTYVTLIMISAFKKANKLDQERKPLSPLIFTPKLLKIEEGTCFLYEGDAGYEGLDLHRTGSRHRLWAMEGGWRYERSEWADG